MGVEDLLERTVTERPQDKEKAARLRKILSETRARYDEIQEDVSKWKERLDDVARDQVDRLKACERNIEKVDAESDATIALVTRDDEEPNKEAPVRRGSKEALSRRGS